jgi:hypothetical protein
LIREYDYFSTTLGRVSPAKIVKQKMLMCGPGYTAEPSALIKIIVE